MNHASYRFRQALYSLLYPVIRQIGIAYHKPRTGGRLCRMVVVRYAHNPYTFPVRRTANFFRIVVTDAEGKCAYTNAYFVADLLEKKDN